MTDDRHNNPVYKTWISLMRKEAEFLAEGLTDAERVFKCVYLLDMEVFNGGYDQYFFNSSGNDARYVVDALLAIGAPRATEVTKEAIEYVFGPAGAPADRFERQDALDRAERRLPNMDEVLGELDRAYWSETTENVDTFLESWATKHGFAVK